MCSGQKQLDFEGLYFKIAESIQAGGLFMNFSIHGPYEIPRSGNRINRDKEALRDFWKSIDEKEPNLSQSIGCYVFGIRAGRGIKPWYVGMNSRQSFSRECFTPSKLLIYTEANIKGKGTPVLFLVAKRTKKKKLSKISKNELRILSYVETLLIGAALEKNSDLVNIQKTAFLRKIEVPGVLNTPRRPSTLPEREFKTALYRDLD